MSEVFAALNGHRLTALRLVVGNLGPWIAECDFEGAPDLVTGRATITIGPLSLLGTIAQTQGGTFGLQRKCRVVAGAGGWSLEVPSKDYHNDAGVKARTIAEDAARAVGEQLGTFVPRVERVGVDFVREVGPAARTLEAVLGGAPWWVDYAGVTHAGPRPGVPAAPSAYEVLAYDPRLRVATLALDDPGAVRVGSVIVERLDEPQTVRELELTVDSAVRVTAWCSSAADARAHLAGLLQSIARRATDARLLGLYRYRVVRMASARVELQAVRARAGLPDLSPVSMWPGVAGMHVELTPGAEVLVEFVEGDRAQPIVTHFAGKDGIGFVPVEVVIGGEVGAPSARSGDAVEVLLPPAVFSGTIGGAPASGVLTFVLSKTLGVITAGSGKVKVAS